MRILYHHRTQGVGVEGVHIRETVKALRALGHTVGVVSPPGISVFDQAELSRRPPSAIRRFWRRISRRLPEIGFELMELAYNGYALRALARELSQERYDAVYERYAIFNWAGASQARRHGVPFLLEVNYTSWSPLSRMRHSSLRSLAHRIDRWLLRQADGIIVVSTALRRHLVEDLGVPPHKILVLPNAADPAVFNPATVNGDIRSRHHLDGKKVIGFTGRFLPWHGLERLVEAMPSILRAVPDAAFLLIGEGPSRAWVEEQVRAQGLDRHVVFAGEVSHARLPDYLTAFDVAVLPHSNDYGSPMKLFEYMAMAKPTVAPRLGPLEDVVTHDLDGVLFEPEQTDQMAQALIALLRDDARRRRMGEAARATIAAKHTWMANARAIVALHEMVRMRCS